GEVEEGAGAAYLAPPLEGAVRERGVTQLRDLRHRDGSGPRQRPPGPGASPLRRPPATAACGRGDQAHHALVPVDDADDRDPDGHAADVVLRAVDRVDDPAAVGGAGGAVLLPDDGVPNAGARELGADGLLARAV